jgi:ABC-type multidrug transport system fused ATPase/permease subunit
MSIAIARLKVRLQEMLFRTIVMQEQAFFDTSSTGELVSRLSSDTTKVGDMVSLNINIFLRSFIAAAGSLAFMFALSWRLTIEGNVREIGEGTDSQRIVFFFTNAHIADKSFFENINNMLTTGMIPGLYAEEEKLPFCESMQNAARALDLPETKDTLWSLHVQHVRSNLHVVLAMSFVGDTLHVRCRNFPGLVSNSATDWFTPWPEDALSTASARFITAEDVEDDTVKQPM